MMTSKTMLNYKTKVEFRQFCKQMLQRYSKIINKRAIDKKIAQRLYLIISREKHKRILAYVPMKTEVDIMPLIKRLRAEGRLVFVPFMEHESFRMVKYRLPLTRKKFGIQEPKNSKQFNNKKIDLAIVPILGIDISGSRIGFGKGMYDRFFEKEQKNIKKIAFVSRKLFINSIKITDEYDISSRIIVSS